MRKQVNWKEALEALRAGGKVKIEDEWREGKYVHFLSDKILAHLCLKLILAKDDIFEIEVPDPPAPRKTEIWPIEVRDGRYLYRNPHLTGSPPLLWLSVILEEVNWTGRYQHKLPDGTLILSPERVLFIRGADFHHLFFGDNANAVLAEGWRLTEIVGVEMIVEEI